MNIFFRLNSAGDKSSALSESLSTNEKRGRSIFTLFGNVSRFADFSRFFWFCRKPPAKSRSNQIANPRRGKRRRVGFRFIRFIAMTFRFRQRAKFRFRPRFHRRAAKQQNEPAQPDGEQTGCCFSCFLPREERIHQP
jgi:hypothetical protein